jgi:hypothetical protein
MVAPQKDSLGSMTKLGARSYRLPIPEFLFVVFLFPDGVNIVVAY